MPALLAPGRLAPWQAGPSPAAETIGKDGRDLGAETQQWKRLDVSPMFGPVFGPQDLGGAGFLHPSRAAWPCPLFEVRQDGGRAVTQQLRGQGLPLRWSGPGNAGQELLAVVPQARGRELTENGTNDKETASEWT